MVVALLLVDVLVVASGSKVRNQLFVHAIWAKLELILHTSPVDVICSIPIPRWIIFFGLVCLCRMFEQQLSIGIYISVTTPLICNGLEGSCCPTCPNLDVEAYTWVCTHSFSQATVAAGGSTQLALALVKSQLGYDLYTLFLCVPCRSQDPRCQCVADISILVGLGRSGAYSIWEWVDAFLLKKFVETIVIYWEIWKSRDAILFENKEFLHVRIIQCSIAVVKEISYPRAISLNCHLLLCSGINRDYQISLLICLHQMGIMVL